MNFLTKSGVLFLFIILKTVSAKPIDEIEVNNSSKSTNTSKQPVEVGKSDTDQVTIYTNDNFFGVPWTLTMSNCTDVPFLLYKKTSSIDTHNNCVILFARQNCTGSRFVKIEPGTSGHSRLSAVNFDETLASLRKCSDYLDSAPSVVKVTSPGEHIPSSKSRSRRNIPDFLLSLIQNLELENYASANSNEGSQAEEATNILPSLLKNFDFNSMLNQNQDKTETSDESEFRVRRVAKSN